MFRHMAACPTPAAEASQSSEEICAPCASGATHNATPPRPDSAAQATFVTYFNACHDSPKKALAAVHRAGLSAREAAQLLHAGGGAVSVELLGECLGHRDPFWQALAFEFPACFEDFGTMSIVEALRTYLWRLRLPGESMLIERILEGFAAAYFKHNPPPTAQGTAAYPWTQGWYVEQPTSADGTRCCAHCGSVGKDPMLEQLRTCQGCQVVTFCRKCSQLASKRGHAVVGAHGYGRACIEARRRAGWVDGGVIKYRECVMGGRPSDCEERVREGYKHWPRVSPFLSKDAVMVLCYSIIMLATNLHNTNIKASQKMQLHQYLNQNRGINDGENFPGDFLAWIYENIRADELKVLGMGVF